MSALPAEKARRALVFGATGYTGRALVEQLARRGDAVVAHIRPGSPQAARFRGPWEALGARVRDAPFDFEPLEALVREAAPEVVFIAIGTTAARARKEGLGADGRSPYEAVDVELTRRILAAVAAEARAARVVFVSSAGAGGATPGAYMQARRDAELLVRQSGLPFTIARPSFITGPDRDERRLGERVGAALMDGALRGLRAVGLGGAYASLGSTTGEALARGLIRVADDAAFRNRVAEAADLR